MAIQINKTAALGAASSIVKSVVANINIGEVDFEDSVATSYMGTPVIDNLEFPAGSYVALDGTVIDYPSIRVDTVTFEVSRPKRIIKTHIQGRDDAIKEYVGNGDFAINCSGIISSSDNLFPEEDLRNLIKVFEVPQQVPIVSLFLNDMFEIFNIVIESYNVPQVAGKRNEIPFSFVASQDFNLEVNDITGV
jgi:hypothetical protein